MKKVYIVMLVIIFFVANVGDVMAATISANDLVINGNTCYKNFHNDVTNQNKHWTIPSEFITVDGKTAYCVDFGVDLQTGNANFQESYLTMLNDNKGVYNKISLIGLFGYSYPGHNTTNYYGAAQLLIWQEVTDAGLYPSYKVSDMNFYSSNAGYQAGQLINLEAEKAEILKLVNDYYKLPSICGKRYTIEKGDSLTATDTNSVLDNYSIDSSGSDSIKVSTSGNTLSIDAIDVGSDIKVTLSKGMSDETTFVYGVNSGQKVVVPSDYPELSCSFTVEVFEEEEPEEPEEPEKPPEEGYIQIKKVDKDTDEPLEGVKFSIYNSNDEIVDTVVTNEKGIAISQKLPYGKYYILEVESLDGYILNEDRIDVEIDANDTFEVEFTNVKDTPEPVPTGDILIGVVWAIGLFCLGLGIHYYTEFKKKES